MRTTHRSHPSRVAAFALALTGLGTSIAVTTTDARAASSASAAAAVYYPISPSATSTADPHASAAGAMARAMASRRAVKQKRRARDWILTGFFSKHFSEDNRENDKNFGVFFEHDISRQWGLYFGQYTNSGKIESHLIAVTWQPMHIGPVHVGFEGGIVDGYMQLNHGHFAPAALPFLSYTTGFVKANLFCIPPVIKTAAPVCSLQFGANLEDLADYANKLRTSRLFH
jgi:hypothetical protein